MKKKIINQLVKQGIGLRPIDIRILFRVLDEINFELSGYEFTELDLVKDRYYFKSMNEEEISVNIIMRGDCADWYVSKRTPITKEIFDRILESNPSVSNLSMSDMASTEVVEEGSIKFSKEEKEEYDASNVFTNFCVEQDIDVCSVPQTKIFYIKSPIITGDSLIIVLPQSKSVKVVNKIPPDDVEGMITSLVSTVEALGEDVSDVYSIYRLEIPVRAEMFYRDALNYLSDIFDDISIGEASNPNN